MYDKRLIVTEDGSHSIELIGQNEQYHSIHGAIQESQHVFIDFGLNQIFAGKKNISILEVGMGTGLNVYLTYIFALEKNIKIKYITLEPFPIEKDIWEKLNYKKQLNRPEDENIFEGIHSSEWNKEIELSSSFSLLKINKSIVNFELERKFDMVYFDAFNPDLEPNLWTEEIFNKIFQSMSKNSLLSTYSTKGIVKRALRSCGFEIQKQPGPPGKREILNAWKKYY